MVGWHHRLDGHEFEQAPGVSDGQGTVQCMGSQIVWHDWATELNWKQKLSQEPSVTQPVHAEEGNTCLIADSHSWCVWSAFSILGTFSIFIHFIWLLWVLVMARGIVSFRMWALIPQPGMEPGPPALGVQSFSLWATREVPCTRRFFRSFICIIPFYPQITPPISTIWRTGKLKQGEIELSAQDQVAFKGQSRVRDPDGWLHCLKWSEVKLLSHVQLFATPWTVAYQAPPSVGFSRQEYWSGLPFGLLVNKAGSGDRRGQRSLEFDKHWYVEFNHEPLGDR